MTRIIKLTKQQIIESSLAGFNYLNGGDTPHYCGQTEISVTGKLNQDEYGDPTTTDKISRSLSPQTYNRYGVGSQGYRKRTNEDVQTQTDDDNEIDNFYKKNELDTLGNGVENDNLTRIPEGIEYKLNLLLSEVKSCKLTPKQQAIVLNKIIEDFQVKDMPYSWKKTLMLKIRH